MSEEIPAGNAAFIALMSICLVMSFLGNVLIIVVILKNKHMLNAVNLLIVNLAVSDICLGCFIVPMQIHDITHADEFHEGEFMCRIINGIPIFCICISIYSLVAMSHERYRAICILTSSPMSIFDAKKIMAGIATLAAITAAPSVVEYSVYDFDVFVFVPTNESIYDLVEHDEDIPHFSARDTNETGTLYHRFGHNCGSAEMPRMLGTVNAFFLLFVAYIIPLIIILINYSRLIAFIIRESKAKEQGKQTSQVSKNKVRILKMLIIVAVLFALSWLPFFSIMAMAKVTGKDDSSHFDGAIHMMRIALQIFSVSYNVYLYLTYNSTFRRAFLRLLCPCVRSGAVAPADSYNVSGKNNTRATKSESLTAA